jgi:crossover junction endodeoxyribonuclease RuvC
MKVLAIDPGYDRMGIALLEGNSHKQTVVWSACISPPKGAVEGRLAVIRRAVEHAVKTYNPDALALEKLFFSVNRKTAVGVAEARGAVLSCAGALSLPVLEYSPQEVKLAVTGYGKADKKAVADMVKKLVALPSLPKVDDELDAIALGIAALTKRYPQGLL